MKIIDDVYEMYKDYFTGDEEDVLVVIYGLLDGYKPEDLEKFFNDLKPEEKFEMTVLFLYEKLRLKIAEKGIGHIGNGDDQDGQILH